MVPLLDRVGVRRLFPPSLFTVCRPVIHTQSKSGINLQWKTLLAEIKFI